MSDLKDLTPLEKIDAAPAVLSLSKTQNGAMFVFSLLGIIVLMSFLIYMAANNTGNCEDDKKNMQMRHDAQHERDRVRIEKLEADNYKLLFHAKVLEDSLVKYEPFKNFDVKANNNIITLYSKRRLK